MEPPQSPSQLDPTPLLSPSKHSGIPKRLATEAAAAKQKLFGNKTLPQSGPRRNDTPLPPEVSKEAYDAAIDELRELLGGDHVELNDKPLIDGWYMEHPYVSYP